MTDPRVPAVTRELNLSRSGLTTPRAAGGRHRAFGAPLTSLVLIRFTGPANPRDLTAIDGRGPGGPAGRASAYLKSSCA